MRCLYDRKSSMQTLMKELIFKQKQTNAHYLALLHLIHPNTSEINFITSTNILFFFSSVSYSDFCTSSSTIHCFQSDNTLHEGNVSELLATQN